MRIRIAGIFFMVGTVLLAGCSDQGVVYQDFDVEDEAKRAQESESVIADTNTAFVGSNPIQPTRPAQTALASPPAQMEKKLFASLPTIHTQYEYYRSPLSREIIGQARIKFVDEKTNMPVVGHALDCTNCVDVYITGTGYSDENRHYLETNAQGEAIVNLTEKVGSLSYARVAWYQYPSVALEVGDDKVIKIPAHIVGQNQTLGYPSVRYIKNEDSKTRVQVLVRDKNGNVISDVNILGTGPMFNEKRTSISGRLQQGEVTMDAAVHGVYRLQLLGSASHYFDTLYQVGVLSGHTAVVEIQEKDGQAPPPSQLTPDHVQRGFILVCPVDAETKQSVYATVGIPQSSIQFTASKTYMGYSCAEVPKSYQEIYIPASETQSGHATVSTKGVDDNGVLYVSVNKVS